MLRGLLAPMEKHHGVRISDAAVVAAVRLSQRYIPARQLPDKAVSLLDTACARVAISQTHRAGRRRATAVAIAALEAETRRPAAGAATSAPTRERLDAIAAETDGAAPRSRRWKPSGTARPRSSATSTRCGRR